MEPDADSDELPEEESLAVTVPGTAGCRTHNPEEQTTGTNLNKLT